MCLCAWPRLFMSHAVKVTMRIRVGNELRKFCDIFVLSDAELNERKCIRFNLSVLRTGFVGQVNFSSRNIFLPRKRGHAYWRDDISNAGIRFLSSFHIRVQDKLRLLKFADLIKILKQLYHTLRKWNLQCLFLISLQLLFLPLDFGLYLINRK